MASSKVEPTNGGGYIYCGAPECGLYFQVVEPVEPPIEPTEETPNPCNVIYDEQASYDEYWEHASQH